MCNPIPTGERPWPPGNPHGLSLSYARLRSARAAVGITPRPGALPQNIIETIEEAQDYATQWLWTYKNDRPNMGIGAMTPAQKLNAAA